MDEEAERLKEEGVKDSVLGVFREREVRNALKNVMAEALAEQADEFGKVAFIERQKAVQRNVFISTEKLLYGFSALGKHLANEKEYMEMIFKQSSGSVVRYQKNQPGRPDEEQLLNDRKNSYERSRHDYERVRKALDVVKGKKGFEVIYLKYLSGNEYSYADIADKLAGTDGFSEHLNEKTVRRYKNKLVSEIALLLFGTDAI